MCESERIALTYGEFSLLYLVSSKTLRRIAINSIPTVLTVVLVTEGTL